jgi:hypothetical protein
MKKITYYIYKQEITDLLLETTSKDKANKFFDSLPTGHTMWQVTELNEKLVATNIIKTK